LNKKKRKDARRGILANFQFSLNGKPGEVFKAMTTDVSHDGFGFLTETSVREGQEITIVKHAMEHFTGRKATIIWVTKKAGCFEAGAQFRQSRS